MKILLVSATQFEILPALQWLEGQNRPSVQVLVSGVGVVATTWALTRTLERQRPDLVINAGIAGAYDRNLALGDVVNVVSEQFGDLGVEEADGSFTDVFDLGLVEPSSPPFINGRLENPQAAMSKFLPTVHGLTVSKVHGSAASIEAARKKYPSAQIESMEGAAVFFACLMAGVPFLEIRAISNYVEPRNREAWNIPLAIGQLNEVVVDVMGAM
jgi:futalosine hydrolase